MSKTPKEMREKMAGKREKLTGKLKDKPAEPQETAPATQEEGKE
jgi:hypothetical protein